MTNRHTRVAGLAYVAIILLGVLSAGLIDAKLIVPGDDAATANNIVADELLFRIGIASVLVLYASVLVLSWALYVILKTVDKHLALLALLLRSAEAVLGAATVLVSLGVVVVVHGDAQLRALAGPLLDVRTAALDIVLVFVGLGGTVFFYLFFKSKFLPTALSAWGIFTYVSMLVLAFVSVVWPSHPAMFETLLYALGSVFELTIGFWLLFKGVDGQQWDTHARA
jgi:hypothetical protein